MSSTNGLTSNRSKNSTHNCLDGFNSPVDDVENKQLSSIMCRTAKPDFVGVGWVKKKGD